MLLPLAEKSGKEQTTQPPTAQKAAGNQNAREPVILTTAAFLLFAALVLILFLVPLAEEPGEEQTTQAPTAQKATGNQDAREPVILTTAAFLLFAALVLILLHIKKNCDKPIANFFGTSALIHVKGHRSVRPLCLFVPTSQLRLHVSCHQTLWVPHRPRRR